MENVFTMEQDQGSRKQGSHKQGSRKHRIIKAMIQFAVLIVAFTILSRGAYNMTITRVSVSPLKEMKIAHDITGSGEICSGDDLPVVVKEGIRIQSVRVSVEELVKKGDVLFSLSEEDLDKIIDRKKQEINLLDLQTKTARSAITPRTTESSIIDTSVEQNRIIRRQLTDELSEYQALQKASGKILSPSDGMVTAVNVKAGDRTSGAADVMLAKALSDVFVSCKFDIRDSEWISEDAFVEITLPDRQQVKELNVSSVHADQDDPNGLLVIIKLPKEVSESLLLGTKVEVVVHAPSRTYYTCIPRSALHQSDRNSYYVNTMKEIKTVLGEETFVVRNEVTLLDINDDFAAIDGLAPEQEIIVESDRTLKPNGKVKRIEKTVTDETS
jgi:multidrug efflux pump subunit AcrA (membrane-fusion protein)